MSVKNETTSPTPKIRLSDPKTDANPPWTGTYFVCEQCGAKFQLGAADDCEPADVPHAADANFWLAPPCWGNPREEFFCGFRNVIRTPRFTA